jgi:hypothetical protein
MTKKNRLTVVALVGWLVIGNVASVSASLVINWQYINTQADTWSFLSDPDVSVVGTGQFRAGGTTAPEIRVQNGEMDLGQPFDSGDLTWDILGGDNTLLSEFGTATGGNFNLEATGSGGTPDTAYSLPVDWFNQVLFEFDSEVTIASIIGDVNGQVFNLTTDWSTFAPEDRYDAVLFTFDNPIGTTPDFSLSATMSMTTPYPGLADDDFQANTYLIQNVSPVPEPTTFGLFGIGMLMLGVRKIRRRFVIG